MELFERLDSWFFLFTVGMLAWTLITNPRHVAAFFRQAFNRQPGEAVSSVSSQDYDNPPAAAAVHSAADRADGGLSGGLSGLSALQRHALLSIMMDKGFTVVEQRAVATPKRLVFALVALGWSTSQIRQVVKGDNNALSEQIREAREFFGLVDERVIGVGKEGREVRL